MRQIALVLLVIVLHVLPAAAWGQEEDDVDDEPVCSFEPTLEVLVNLMQQVESWEELERFNRDLSASLAYCRELIFEGTGDAVIGPFDLAAGIYTVQLTGNTTAAIGETVAGRCDILFSFTDETVTLTEEAFRSDGCSQLVTIDSGGAWALQFAPVETFDIVTPEEALLAFTALLIGELDTTNEYFCPTDQLAPQHGDAFRAAVGEGSLTCSYDDFIMACGLQATEGEEPPPPLVEMTIEEGLLCHVQFSE